MVFWALGPHNTIPTKWSSQDVVGGVGQSTVSSGWWWGLKVTRASASVCTRPDPAGRQGGAPRRPRPAGGQMSMSHIR